MKQTGASLSPPRKEQRVIFVCSPIFIKEQLVIHEIKWLHGSLNKALGTDRFKVNHTSSPISTQNLDTGN